MTVSSLRQIAAIYAAANCRKPRYCGGGPGGGTA